MIERLSDHLRLLQYAHVLWGFALFCGLAGWALWPGRKGEMQRHATLILSDDATLILSDDATLILSDDATLILSDDATLILSDDTPAERGRHEQ